MQTESWDIYRCNASKTISLSKQIRDLGIRVFCPSMTVRRRKPRSSTYELVEIAMLPTFLFVQSQGVTNLLNAAGLSRFIKPMMFNGRFANCSSHDLVLLEHEIEVRKSNAKKVPGPDFKVGDRVKINKGVMNSISAHVISINGATSIVDFGGIFGQVEISTFLLRRFGV